MWGSGQHHEVPVAVLGGAVLCPSAESVLRGVLGSGWPDCWVEYDVPVKGAGSASPLKWAVKWPIGIPGGVIITDPKTGEEFTKQLECIDWEKLFGSSMAVVQKCSNTQRFFDLFKNIVYDEAAAKGRGILWNSSPAAEQTVAAEGTKLVSYVSLLRSSQ
jgi:hypothetical protein